MTRPVLGRLGPFVGGMNSFSAPSAIGDNELVDCVNFEVDIDGSLASRPPIISDSISTTVPVGNNRKVCTGNGIIGGVAYTFWWVPNVGIYSFNGTDFTQILASTTFVSYVSVQVADLIVFFPANASTATGGYYWDGTTMTNDANIPKSEAAVLYKQRLWCVPGMGGVTPSTYNQLRFSEPINPAAPTPFTWTATNSIGINPGDGQKLVDLQIYNDNLMLFKQDSTYIFAYDVLPSDGAVKAVNTTIGASARNCVAAHDNSSYVYHEGSVYEIVNYTFSKINVKVPFTLDTSADGTRQDNVFICTVGDRLVVRYFNRIYVYATRTRSWSRWTSALAQNFGPFVEMPKLTADGSLVKYYAGHNTNGTNFHYVFAVQDGYDGVTLETMQPYIITKNYDFGQSSGYKKLAWWGADLYGTGEVDAQVSPVFLSGGFTWAQLHATTWGSLGTWIAPITVDNSTTTQVISGGPPQRIFTKFLKSMRFRQIFFKITMNTDGSVVTGPARIYSLTVVVGMKQLVPEIVN